jgi:GNAT superfamily N-acetyltransferase
MQVRIIPYSEFPALVAERFLTSECFSKAEISPDSFVAALFKDEVLLSLFTFTVKIIRNRAIYEIYNVCTSKDARGRGHAKVLFDTFKKDVVSNNATNGYPAIVWLGVELNNISIVKVYLKMGFNSPRLTNKTAGGVRMEFPFISLVWRYPLEKNSKDSPDEIHRKVTRMVRAYYSTVSMPKTSVGIRLEDLSNLYSHVYSEDKFEVGGPLIKRADGVCVVDAFEKRRGREDFTVQFKPTPFNFHTHPIEAYLNAEAIIGSPSSMDYTLALNGISAICFVVALEGVYCISTSPFVRYFLEHLKEEEGCLGDFTDVVQTYFSTESFRTRAYIEPQMNKADWQKLLGEIRDTKRFYLEDSIRGKALGAQSNIIQHVNSISIKNLLNFGASSNVKFDEARARVKGCVKRFTDLDLGNLLHLQFISWATIKSFAELNVTARFEAFYYE